jgi:hypothetical protein
MKKGIVVTRRMPSRFLMEREPHIDKLVRGMENVMNMPEGPTKRGLIDAGIETVYAMHARKEITDDERRRLLAILCDPHVGNPFSEN